MFPMTQVLVIDGRPMNATEIAELNVDWFGWADAPGGEQFEAGYGAQVDADLDAGATWPEIVEQFELGYADQVSWDHEPFGEDVDFAQQQMVAECAEASWHRFCINGH
jgi:hypothetical protein